MSQLFWTGIILYAIYLGGRYGGYPIAKHIALYNDKPDTAERVVGGFIFVASCLILGILIGVLWHIVGAVVNPVTP